MRAHRTWLLAVILAVLAPVAALAADVTINFTYTAGAATAVGSMTLDPSLLPANGSSTINLPNPGVRAINITVSGAASGNGHFTAADFAQVAWDTGGATLDFGQQLVGQPTPGGAWGTPTGCCGDFNFFQNGVDPAAPRGVFFFTLGADNGGADAMVLSSALVSAPIPTLDQWMLVLLAIMLITVGIAVHRRA